MTILTGRRVGTQPTRAGCTYTCDRCGIERATRVDRPTRMCRDCQDVLALTECEATTPSAQKGTTA